MGDCDEDGVDEMHLTRMSYGGVPPFTKRIELDLGERVNVFVGPNGSGKSTILLMLDELFNGVKENSKRPVSNTRPLDKGERGLRASIVPIDGFDELVSERERDGRPPNLLAGSEDWVGTMEEFVSNPNPPAIYIGSIREGLPAISEVEDANAYGETAAEVLAGPFSGSRTMCAYSLVGNEALEISRSVANSDPVSLTWSFFRDAEKLAGACIKRICNELIEDPEARNYIHGYDVRGYLNSPDPDLSRIPIKSRMGIRTTDARNFAPLTADDKPSYSAYREPPNSVPIYLGHLSSGTEVTVLWIRWLALKLVHHYEFQQGWEKKPAILLIDEIENHLHPTWQRRVIPALLEHFPGLQIFATTHSPFVVAGLRAGQVHLLKRDENGVVTASTNTEDIVGWTADEILRNLMGVEEPTDQLTVDRANRLRQLREKETLTAEEESELDELRRQVNEDLLSKEGSLGSQRERYADLMEQFIRSRQNELSQDGD